MKKTKLLMPILGVAAVAGTAIPTIVACSPAEEEKSNVTSSIEVTTRDYDEGYRIADVKKVTPVAVPGEEYFASFSWREINSSRKEIANSYCYQAIVYKADGETQITSAQIYKQQHGSVNVYVPGEDVVEGMQIVVQVQYGSANVVQELATGADVPTYDESSTKPGVISANFSGLTTDDDYIEYKISLGAMEAYLKTKGKTLVGATKIAFWMDRAEAVLGVKRVTPSSRGYVYLGQKRQSNVTWSDQSRAITITLDHNITEAEAEGGEICSYFGFERSLIVDLNGGHCAAYCMNPRNIPDKTK